MAAVTLRSLARNAMLAGGGRGFMRFAPEGDALLVTDALRRCGNEAEKAQLIQSLCAAGFDGCEAEGLLYLAPKDALLCAVCAWQDELPAVDWESEGYETAAFAVRLLRCDAPALTQEGRRLVIEALRLTGTPGVKLNDGIGALRARAAVMLRKGDRSGMRETGAILMRAM